MRLSAHPPELKLAIQSAAKRLIDMKTEIRGALSRYDYKCSCRTCVCASEAFEALDKAAGRLRFIADEMRR
ncbi:MAG: hypothetical protein Q8Q14_10030 [Gemmatimonadales bacterium]|nr:hypothetical protein [Gemmatimonadales bacterium]